MYDDDTFNMLIREINFEYSYVRNLPFRKNIIHHAKYILGSFNQYCIALFDVSKNDRKTRLRQK